MKGNKCKLGVLGSILAFCLVALFLSTEAIGSSTAYVVNDTAATWHDSETAATNTLDSARNTTQTASLGRLAWNNRDTMTLSFDGQYMWREWTSVHQYEERTAHFAARRSPEVINSDATFEIDGIRIEEVAGENDYTGNFSWELWNLRGYSNHWQNCTDDNIEVIREGRGNSERIAYGDTLRDFNSDGTDTGRSLTNAAIGGDSNVNRDGNYCLIISETAGGSYHRRDVDECFHFEFILEGVDGIPGSNSSWSNRTNFSLDFLNVGNPNGIPNGSYDNC